MSPQSALAFAEYVALALLCLPFIVSGIEKARDFAAAAEEIRQLGLPHPQFVAATVIALQIVAPVMILGGILTWAAALALAGFIAAATLVAHAFWRMPLPERHNGRRVFLEHFALAGALLLVACIDLSGIRGVR